MQILALETSGTTGSVAALDDAQLVGQLELPAGQRSAQSLVPTIQALVAQVGWPLGAVELLAVTSGPGSFTSLRIGVSTAKALAYALGAQILGVNTLEVVARQAPAQHSRVHVAIDAQREQLFTATLTRSAADRFDQPWSTTVVDNQAWLDALRPGDVVTGPGLQRLADRLPQGVIAVERSLWAPTAAMVGRLGWEQFAAGRRDDVFQLVPHYFRRTAAEEQWERRESQAK